ncbi:39S ribosomal protein L27, mitochondrial [Frankliniella occidentalis]|uniref:Large ribosomal subunit protein bL27m n=1 Tax=Frankliniella occidentalis TaxID=133901 RepID=A0A6J1S1L7_FRAOC|nr:39S ribosomal protein L27, mitochondrial [Frankliniella occidentalis]
MNFLSNLSKVPNIPSYLLELYGGVRFASKKTSSGARWQGNGKKPKRYRGLKRKDGDVVTAGTILATQITLRFFPGLNVGFGKNGSIFAIKAGKVVMSSELAQPNWDHTWIQRLMPRRPDNIPIYKKYINIIPEPQHNRFKLLEAL